MPARPAAHSDRSATIGIDARRASRRDEAGERRHRQQRIAVPANVAGPRPDAEQQRRQPARHDSDAAEPSATPMPASFRPSPTTSRNTSSGVAPSAIRTPISVRPLRDGI